MTPPLVVARGLTRRYGEGAAQRSALEGLELELREGEAVLLFGPSGSGKSTLLALLGLLDRQYEGTLEVLGCSPRDATDEQLALLRNDSIGFVFQAFHLLGHLGALDNVCLPAVFSARLTPELARRRGLELLERLGLGGREGALPHELSGGQRQRVAVARALLLSPRLLLCDEPTGNLDSASGARLAELLAELHRDQATTLVIATHDERLAALATRRLLLVDGRLLQDAAA